MNHQSSSHMKMPALLRVLLLVALTSMFSAGCANTTRVTRSPDNNRALSSDTLVVEQKGPAVDATKPGVLGPFDTLVVFALQLFDSRY
jgi:hypothetical protein